MPGPVIHGHEYLRRLGPETTTKDCPKKVAFVPDHGILAALGHNGRLRLIPREGGKEISVSVGAPSTMGRTHLVASPEGDFVLAGRCCVDPQTGAARWSAKPKEPWGSELAAVVTPDGRTAFAGCYRLDTATGKQAGFLADTCARHTGGAQPVTASAISRDGKTLATGDSSGNVVLTSVAARNGSVLAGGNEDDDSATQGVFTSIDALAFGRDWLAVAGQGTQVQLLSPRDLSLVRSLTIQPSMETRGLAFAPDGVTLVAATLEPGRKTGHVRVWNARTGKEQMRVTLDERVMLAGWLSDLAVSEDGSTIALALSRGPYLCDMPRR